MATAILKETPTEETGTEFDHENQLEMNEESNKKLEVSEHETNRPGNVGESGEITNVEKMERDPKEKNRPDYHDEYESSSDGESDTSTQSQGHWSDEKESEDEEEDTVDTADETDIGKRKLRSLRSKEIDYKTLHSRGAQPKITATPAKKKTQKGKKRKSSSNAEEKTKKKPKNTNTKKQGKGGDKQAQKDPTLGKDALTNQTKGKDTPTQGKEAQKMSKEAITPGKEAPIMSKEALTQGKGAPTPGATAALEPNNDTPAQDNNKQRKTPKPDKENKQPQSEEQGDTRTPKTSNEKKEKTENMESEIKKLREKLDTLKRRRDETEEELKEEKAKRKRTQEKKEGYEREFFKLERELRETKDENDRLRMEIGSLERENRLKIEKIERAERIMESQEREIRAITKTADEKGKKIDDLLKKMEKMNLQAQESENERRETEKAMREDKYELESVSQTIERQRKYIVELEEINNELIARITKKNEPQQQQEGKRTQALLIADSNGREIIPHLKGLKTEWKRTTNTVKTEHLDTINKQDLENFETIAILLGTNNVKNGSDGQIEAEKYIGQINNLTTKTTAKLGVILIPQIDTREGRIEREIFNRHVRRNMCKGVTIIETPEECKKMAAQDVLKDQLHLTEQTAKFYAKAIHKFENDKREERSKSSTRENRESRGSRSEMERKEQQSYDTRETMETTVPRHMLPQFFGRQGHRVQELARKHEVRIQAAETGDPAKVEIKGKGARQAKKEIEEFVERMKEKEEKNAQMREEKRNEPCRFYREGRCDKGNKCFYRHDDALKYE